jgi:lipoprotein-anchoring transpeptidase ErfK/SrfK
VWCNLWVAVASSDPRRRRPLVGLVGVIAALLLAAGAIVVVRSLDDDPVEAAPVTTTTTTTAPTTTTVPLPKPVVPASTDLATPKGEVPTFAAPNGSAIGKVGVWYGYPMTIPILQEAAGGWLRVMLPERPNGSSAWVRESDVTRSTTPYRIVLKLGETRTHVYKDGFEVFSAAVGVGKDSTPTPQGSFFVAVIEHDLGGGYGPIVLDLNAHSEAIQSWEGSGDAITAFHGPFGAQSLIRSGGGKVSNGCIRMLPEDQLKMGVIPLGTPVDIVA